MLQFQWVQGAFWRIVQEFGIINGVQKGCLDKLLCLGWGRIAAIGEVGRVLGGFASRMEGKVAKVGMEPAWLWVLVKAWT